jgi:hypothetical protein
MGGIFESFALLREYKEEAGEELTKLQTGYKHGGKTGSCTAVDRIQRGRKDKGASVCSCRQDTSREDR